jgi:hypothetical protein
VPRFARSMWRQSLPRAEIALRVVKRPLPSEGPRRKWIHPGLRPGRLLKSAIYELEQLRLLPRQGDADGLLRRDEMIEAFGILGNRELDALDDSVELVSTCPVVR